VLQPGISVMLPDGLTLADGQEVDGAALAAFLDGPPAEFATGVRASSLQVFWALGLWLATGDRRSCGVAEEQPAEDGDAARLARAPLRSRGMLATAGIVDSGGIAVLLAADQPDVRSGQFTLEVTGFGPHGAELGAALAAHVQAWDRAGQPGTARLHVDAYPRSSPDEPAPASDALLIERPATRFVVRHTPVALKA
jgi:protein-L-isoaspartate(D-aspartate) O-methyltransferase